jgi:lipopolysaccharide transport system permease protein
MAIGGIQASGQPRHEEIIEPPRAWGFPDLRSLWRYRELLVLLARRDLAVRYRQTAVGIAWVVVQPVAYAAVFSLALTYLRASPSSGIPYPVFVLTGLTIWLFLAGVLARVSASLVGSSALISKLHFPRIVLPVASVLPQLVDVSLAFGTLIGVMLVYGVIPDPTILLAPVFVALGLSVVFGAGLWLAAVAVRFRDVQQIVPFIIQIGLFASPVIYPLALLPESAQRIMALNPLTGALEGFRWAVLPDEAAPGLGLLLWPLVVAAVLIVSGLIYFRRAEDAFADVI